LRVKKAHHKKFTVGSYIIILFAIGIGYFCLTVAGSLATDYIRQSRVTTTTTQPVEVIDLEAVILETKGKLLQANVFIRLTDGNTATIGSGVIFDQNESFYYALTNYHVIDGYQEQSKTVATYDLMSSDFDVIKSSELYDLAIIRFPKFNRAAITPLEFEDELSLGGEFVLSAGNPMGLVGSVTIGTILEYTTIETNLDESHEAIKHTALIGSGSSGGALVNMYGNLIGINAWGFNGSYYAIPISIVLNFIEIPNQL